MIHFKIALRNVLAQKFKTAVIGIIIVFGTVLAIVGNAFVDAVSSGMERSLISSITGHIQIFSKDAKEKLSVYGTSEGGVSDIGHVNDFLRVRDTLIRNIPEIKDIIPMGSNMAFFSPGNIMDVRLEELRALLKPPKRDTARIHALKNHLRAMVSDINDDFHNNVEKASLFAQDNDFKNAPADIAKATAPGFWTGFDSGGEQKIEFLANRIAPLIFDDNVLMFHFFGTVPQAFAREFGLFEIAKGSMIPPGMRGFLFGDYFYENYVKHRIARRLDSMKRKIEKDGQTISRSKALQDLVTANVSQAAEIYSQVSPDEARKLVPALQRITGSGGKGFRKLVAGFLRMTDADFADRYRFFYDHIAPHIVLYRVKIGEIFPLTAISKSGYTSSVNVKVYGTFQFKSFESSMIAGNFSIVDMISFREMYGFMTAEKKEQSKALEKEMGISDFGRDEMESMFSKSAPAAAPNNKPGSALISKMKSAAAAALGRKQNVIGQEYSKEDFEGGPFPHATVILKNPRKIKHVMKRIAEVSSAEKLGIQAEDWREAAGFMGQLAFVVRAILYVCVIVIFIVAAFIIMNSMLMATMERSREIGTMRAIGAQKKTILSMFLNEAFILSAIFGLIGTAIGILIILIIGHVGIPASGDIASFFFSGPRLYLSVNGWHILIVLLFMSLVSVLSTQYPAIRAMRISPLEAMQRSE